MARAPSYRSFVAAMRQNPELEIEEAAVEIDAPRRGRGAGRDRLDSHYRNWARQYAAATGQKIANPADFGDDY